MRRFSQRNSLVTLSDINITPLLDLAFVLLIIFVITTPALTQSLNLDLPKGGRREKNPLSPRDVRTVEVSREGELRLERQPMSLGQIEARLKDTFRANPNLVVYILADKNTRFDNVMAVLNLCQKHDITKFSVRELPN